MFKLHPGQRRVGESGARRIQSSVERFYVGAVGFDPDFHPETVAIVAGANGPGDGICHAANGEAGISSTDDVTVEQREPVDEVALGLRDGPQGICEIQSGLRR